MQLKESWKNTELYKEGKVELLPTELIYKYWGTDVTPMAEYENKVPCTLEELWENLKNEGLDEPFIMRVGLKNKMFRLEAGNHRIQVCHKYGVEYIPVTVQVKENCGPGLPDVMTDATLNFEIPEGELLINQITSEYMAPSQVLKMFKENKK